MDHKQNKPNMQKKIINSSPNAQNTRIKGRRRQQPSRLPPPNYGPLPDYGQQLQLERIERNIALQNQNRNRTRKSPKKEDKSNDWWKDLLVQLGPKALQYGISLLTGFGDYTVTSNSLLAAASEGANGNVVPILENGKDHNRISHREYLGDILSSVDFKVNKFVVNPGLTSTFPWMAIIAQQYTKYVLTGAVFEFVSLTSPIGVNVPYLGYVVMASQYNSVDPPFFDKKSMENSEYASSSKPSENLIHPIECARSSLGTDMLYIRTGSGVTGDPRLYDLSNFSIATGGQQTDGQKMGELWITYDLKLYFPKFSTNRTIFTTYYEAQILNFNSLSPINTLIESPLSSIHLAVMAGGQGVSFPIGLEGQRYLVEFYWVGVRTFCSAMVVTETGCDAEDIVFSPTFVSPVDQSSTCMMSFTLLITHDVAHFTLSGGAINTYGAAGPGTLRITQIPNSA